MAITSVTYRPSYLSPGYNPIIWTFRSNQYNLYQQYKYVIDVYIDGVKRAQLKQFPNPQGYCTVDVSSVVRPYLDISMDKTLVNTISDQVYYDNENASRHVYIKVGEEFLVNGALTVFDGVTTGTSSPNPPAFGIYSSFNIQGNRYEVPVHVWAASLDYTRIKYHLSNSNINIFPTGLTAPWNNAGYFGLPANINPLRVGYWASPPTGSNVFNLGMQMPLTYRGTIYSNNSADPIEMDMYGSALLNDFSIYNDPGDRVILSYINWNPSRFSYFSGLLDFETQDSNIFSFSFSLRRKDNDLVEGSIMIPVTTLAGAGPRTSCTDLINNEEDARYDILHVKINSELIFDLLSNTSAVNIEDYHLEVIGWGRPKALDITGEDCTTLGWQYDTYGTDDYLEIARAVFSSSDPDYERIAPPITKPVYINVRFWCNNLYSRLTLEWLNDLGGTDSMPFTAFVEKNTDVKGETYSTDLINWSTGTPTPSDSLSDPYSGADRSFNRTARTSYTIQTDWITQEDADILEGLLKSPRVIGKLIPTSPFDAQNALDLNLLADQYFSCNVIDTNYVTKLVKAQKLVQATFKIQIPVVQNMPNN